MTDERIIIEIKTQSSSGFFRHHLQVHAHPVRNRVYQWTYKYADGSGGQLYEGELATEGGVVTVAYRILSEVINWRNRP